MWFCLRHRMDYILQPWPPLSQAVQYINLAEHVGDPLDKKVLKEIVPLLDIYISMFYWESCKAWNQE